MNKKGLKNIFFIYIILICAFAIWCYKSPYPKSTTISLAQYVICFLVFIYLIIFKKGKVFKTINLVFLLGLLLLFLNEYFNVFKCKNEILISRFPKDKYEIISSRTGDIINKRLSKSSLKIKKYPFLIKDDKEAKELIKKGYDVVIWKDKNHINLSFKKQKNLKIKDVFSKEQEYTVISDVSKVKIPIDTQNFNNEKSITTFRNTYKDPILAPAIFISNLLYKLKEDEIKLKEIYYQEFFWKHSLHLAYPYFIIGTKYLKNYKSEGNVGELSCAINNYKKALMYIRKSDKDELYFAIINNLMVAYFLKYEETQNFIYKRKAKNFFRKTFPLPSHIGIKNKLIFLENGTTIFNQFE